MGIALSIAHVLFCFLAAILSFIAISDATTRKWGDNMKAATVGVFFIWIAALAWGGLGFLGVKLIVSLA